MIPLLIIVSTVFPVIFIILIFTCLNCFQKPQFKSFNDSRFPDAARNNPSFAVDISDAQASNDQVSIEPLPDILAKTTVTPLRPKITCVEPERQDATLSLVSVQRSFPRGQIQYLNEVGDGWFGKVLDSEASKIVGGNVKSRVMVKMLRDDATKVEQKRFLDEVQAFRSIDHTNLLGVLGQCVEMSPFLVLLEYAPHGNLKTFLLEHRLEAEAMAAKHRFLNFAVDAAAGLACLHKHDFVHNDLAARNCLIMSDYSLKIGDYGISDVIFKEEYMVSGSELLPIRWMAPESLIQSQSLWSSQPGDKSSDMWSFGILLWEIFSVGDRPYAELTDEAVLQGVVLDGVVRPAELDAKVADKNQLWEVMNQCWCEPSQRAEIEQVYSKLDGLTSARRDTLDKSGDFEDRWHRMQPNYRASSTDTEIGSRLGLAGSFAGSSATTESSSPSTATGDDFSASIDNRGVTEAYVEPTAVPIAEIETTVNPKVQEDFAPLPEVTVASNIDNSGDGDTAVAKKGSLVPEPMISVVEDVKEKKLASNGSGDQIMLSTPSNLATEINIAPSEAMSETPDREKDILIPDSSDDVEDSTDFTDNASIKITQIISVDKEDDSSSKKTEPENTVVPVPQESDNAPIEDGFPVQFESLNFSSLAEETTPDLSNALARQLNFEAERDLHGSHSLPLLDEDVDKLVSVSSEPSPPPLLTLPSEPVDLSPSDVMIQPQPLQIGFSDIPELAPSTDGFNALRGAEPEAATGELHAVIGESFISPVGTDATNSNLDSSSSLLKIATDGPDTSGSQQVGTSPLSHIEYIPASTSLCQNTEDSSKKNVQYNESIMPTVTTVSTDEKNKMREICLEKQYCVSNPFCDSSVALHADIWNHGFKESEPQFLNPVYHLPENENTQSLGCYSSEQSNLSIISSLDMNKSHVISETQDVTSTARPLDLCSPEEDITGDSGIQSYWLGQASGSEEEREEVSAIKEYEEDMEESGSISRLGTPDSDCEVSSTTSSSSGNSSSSSTSTSGSSGQEYNCVSPCDTGQKYLDTGQPGPPPPPLDTGQTANNSCAAGEFNKGRDEAETLQMITDLYMSKGMKSSRSFAPRPLETIPEDHILPLYSPQRKRSILSMSDNSSVEVRYEDLFGSDGFEWDEDFYEEDSAANGMNSIDKSAQEPSQSPALEEEFDLQDTGSTSRPSFQQDSTTPSVEQSSLSSTRQAVNQILSRTGLLGRTKPVSDSNLSNPYNGHGSLDLVSSSIISPAKPPPSSAAPSSSAQLNSTSIFRKQTSRQNHSSIYSLSDDFFDDLDSLPDATEDVEDFIIDDPDFSDEAWATPALARSSCESHSLSPSSSTKLLSSISSLPHSSFSVLQNPCAGETPGLDTKLPHMSESPKAESASPSLAEWDLLGLETGLATPTTSNSDTTGENDSPTEPGQQTLVDLM